MIQNQILPIYSEEYSAEWFDITMLYDTNYNFFACLIWWVFNYTVTNKLLDKFSPNEIEIYQTWLYDNNDELNTNLVKIIMDILNDNY